MTTTESVLRLRRQIIGARLKGVDPFNPKWDYNAQIIRDAARCSICDDLMIEIADEDIWTGPGETGLKGNKRNGYTLYQKGWQDSHAAYSSDPTTKMLHICAECMFDECGTFDLEHIHDIALFKSFVPCRIQWFVQNDYYSVAPYGNYFDEGLENDYDLQIIEDLTV